MQPIRFYPVTQRYTIELTGGSGRVETRKWRLFAVFMLVFTVFHLTSPMLVLSQGPATTATGRPMTVTGSTGTVDEVDLTEFEMRNQFATIKDAIPSATVVYRYNLVPVDDFGTCTGCPYLVRIRYRDTGPNQQVVVRLMRAATTTNGVTEIFKFDSNSGSSSISCGLAGSNLNNQTYECPCVVFPPPDITHGEYVYHLEVTVTKTANDGTQSPGFIAFVIGSSTSCAVI